MNMGMESFQHIPNSQSDNVCRELLEIANRLANNVNNVNNNVGFIPAGGMFVGRQNFLFNENSRPLSPHQLENINRYGGPISRPSWDMTEPQIHQVCHFAELTA